MSVDNTRSTAVGERAAQEPELSIKLNLGSGPRAVPGWVNIDRSPNVWLDRAPVLKRAMHRARVLSDAHMAPWDREVQRHDIRRLPYGNATVDAVYTSHVLEHLHMQEARRVVGEAARVLRPGGVLRIASPDAERLARDFVAALDAGDPAAGWRFNERLLAHPVAPTLGVRRLVGKLGAHTHLWQPTFDMVADMCRDAGLTDVVRREFRDGACPDLSVVETRMDSFFVEATKPR
jgi:predicted SAM-dependent methyltransferase